MKRFLLLLAILVLTVPAFAQPAYVFHEKGKALFDQKKYTEAIAEFNKAIKADATYFEAYLDRGRANEELGNTDLAMADYSKTIALNAKYAPGYFYRAKLEAKQGKDQPAITDYSEAIKLNPSYTDSWVNRGLLYVKTKQNDLAMADFNKAVSLDGKNAEVFYQRGILYRDLNKNTEALADFSKASALNPNMANAFFEQGKIHALQKKNDLAVAEFSKTIALGNGTEDVYKRRAAANVALGKNDEALKDYSLVIEQLRSQDPDVFKARGDLFLAQKNYPSAIRDYNKALGFKKDDVTILLARANANYQQGKTKFAAAELDYKKVLTIEADNQLAARGLAKMYFDQEKWQQAIDQLNIVMKKGGTGEDYDMRGKCYFKLNNKKSACEDLTKAEQMGYKDAAKDKMNAGCK